MAEVKLTPLKKNTATNEVADSLFFLLLLSYKNLCINYNCIFVSKALPLNFLLLLSFKTFQGSLILQ